MKANEKWIGLTKEAAEAYEKHFFNIYTAVD
jgi:hypothetical protein